MKKLLLFSLSIVISSFPLVGQDGQPASTTSASGSYQTTYDPPKVELKRIGGHLFRFSTRADLKVVTEFNDDGTTKSVEDNHGRKKTYEYDGAKHVTTIHRGTVVNGSFVDDPAQQSLFAYNRSHTQVYFLSGSKADSVLLQVRKKLGVNPIQHAPRAKLKPVSLELNQTSNLTSPNGQSVGRPGCESTMCGGFGPDPGFNDGFFSYADTYNDEYLGTMTVNNQDYEVTSTVTYGDIVTPIEEFANQVLDYISTPTGKATIVAIAATTMLASPEIAPLVFEAIEASGIFYETVATGTAITAAEITTQTAEQEAESFQEAAQRGRDFQVTVTQALDLIKNNAKYAGTVVKNGIDKIINVIPDANTDGRFAEIKDQKAIYYTQQLQGEVAAAIEEKQPLDLIVSPKTQIISQPLVNAINRTGGTITRFDPTSGARTPYVP